MMLIIFKDRLVIAITYIVLTICLSLRLIHVRSVIIGKACNQSESEKPLMNVASKQKNDISTNSVSADEDDIDKRLAEKTRPIEVAMLICALISMICALLQLVFQYR